MSARRIFTRPARIAAIVPYAWMALFFLVPFAFVLKIALSQTAIAQPPYTPTFDIMAGWDAFKIALSQLSFDNFKLLRPTISTFCLTDEASVRRDRFHDLATGGIPVAYGMSKLPQRWQPRR